MCSGGGRIDKMVLDCVHSMGSCFPFLLPPLPDPLADWVCSTGLSKQRQPNAHAMYYCLLVFTVANLGLFL